MTVTEQIAEIRKLADNTFAMSLCRQFDANGDLSPRQWECVTGLIEQAARPVVTLDFVAIIDLFTLAAKHLKFPKVRLTVSGGGNVVLGRAGPRSRNPGTINVTDGGVYGDNKWYGRISQSGRFERARLCTDDIAELLVKFSADPAGVASEHGKLTGNCCFCGRKLTDERSTAVGYGSTCAGNYSLPWGVVSDKTVACEVCGEPAKPDRVAALCTDCEVRTMTGAA